MSRNLSILAGETALAQIRDAGLKPEMVRLMPGAAGGPKWLALQQMDRYLFGHWFRGRTEPLSLLGSSAGSWRFAVAAQEDPEAAFDRFQQVYYDYRFGIRPGLEEVSEKSRIFSNDLFNDKQLASILEHPYLRISFTAVRSRGLFRSDRRSLQAMGLVMVGLGNLAHPSLVGLGFEQTLFHDPRLEPQFMPGVARVPLSVGNIRKVLLATGAIPLVMCGITDISGAPKGIYRDGGMIDYHFDTDFGVDDGLVLYPHFGERIVPGWFDKKLSWRKPKPANMDRVVLVAPSPHFIESLPMGKIPDRVDLTTFVGRDEERVAYWREVVERTRCLRDELVDALEGDKIRQWARPL